MEAQVVKYFFIVIAIIFLGGMAAATYNTQKGKLMRSYQIGTHWDSTSNHIIYTLYDGNRVVGTVNSACSLDSLVEFDNQ